MTATLNDLILDISLAGALPIGSQGRDFIRATSSVNALACTTKEMQPKELRELEYTIGPLIELLTADIDNPVAAKAALAIFSLMPSRICMSQFLAHDGLMVISRTCDTLLLGNRQINLKVASTQRSVVENLALCYREIGRFYQWDIVKAGAIRHCVLLLRFGDNPLKTIASGTLASLSTDLGICKHMFSNGAIKPLLNVSDGDVTNDACMLAGLGCIVQLCRIPEVAIRVVQQGALVVLEKALHRKIGYGVQAIREKALYALAWLTKVDQVRPSICSPLVLRGMKRELRKGTMPARYTIVQMMLNLHNKYAAEAEFTHGVRDVMLDLLQIGPWHARNLCIKTICVIYKEDEDKVYLVDKGIFEMIFTIIQSKNYDLQEAPMVALLSLCSHPALPARFLQKDGEKVIAQLLYAQDEVIRELAVVFLKSLTLFNRSKVTEAIPSDKHHLMEHGVDEPHLYGSEYGGLIQEYLQKTIETRRDQQYLLDGLTPQDLAAMNIPKELLDSYQNTFMEADLACKGELDIDELKMLMVLLGEEMDVDEIKEVLFEFDKDGSGTLNFQEFALMMNGWATRFGSGMSKVFNEATKRGAVGRARREFSSWWNQDAIAKQEIQEIKVKKLKEVEKRQELAETYWEADIIRVQRETEIKLRAAGLSVSRNYPRKLPVL